MALFAPLSPPQKQSIYKVDFESCKLPLHKLTHWNRRQRHLNSPPKSLTVFPCFIWKHKSLHLTCPLLDPGVRRSSSILAVALYPWPSLCPGHWSCLSLSLCVFLWLALFLLTLFSCLWSLLDHFLGSFTSSPPPSPPLSWMQLHFAWFILTARSFYFLLKALFSAEFSNSRTRLHFLFPFLSLSLSLSESLEIFHFVRHVLACAFVLKSSKDGTKFDRLCVWRLTLLASLLLLLLLPLLNLVFCSLSLCQRRERERERGKERPKKNKKKRVSH